jgi:hypothetical protein
MISGKQKGQVFILDIFPAMSYEDLNPSAGGASKSLIKDLSWLAL